jgi:hypothetical protein
MQLARWRGILFVLIAVLSSVQGFSQTDAIDNKTGLPLKPELRDGWHDFDFSVGAWQTHISRRLHPLSGSDEWVDYVGSSVVHPFWGGRASFAETEADGPGDHIELFCLRLYNPQSRQWGLYYVSSDGSISSPGVLSVPAIGEFRDGRGVFFRTELFRGRSIVVRNVWLSTSSESIRFEQAFSQDGGRTWETNWIAVDTRVQNPSVKNAAPNGKVENSGGAGEHDFDFEFGTWKTHLRALSDPLTGATKWVEFNGTSVVHKIWNGRATMVELEVDGPGGHVEALNLHLYDATSHQWSLNFANSRTGTIAIPTVGEFRNGRGEFYDIEPINGRSVLVRNVWSNMTAKSCHFEQAYSTDGGKTWEVNWIAEDTRVDDESHETH